MKAYNSIKSKVTFLLELENFKRLSDYLQLLDMKGKRDKLYSKNTSKRPEFLFFRKYSEDAIDTSIENFIDIKYINLKSYEDTLKKFITDIGGYNVEIFPENIEKLVFPKENKQQEVVSIEKKTSIQGVIYNIGGEGQKVPVKITDIDGNDINATSSRDLATELAKYLFKRIRLSGNGYWEKFENEGWQLKKLKIESYEILNDISIRDTLKCLNDIGGNQWKELDDPHLELLKIRDDF